MLWGAPVGRSRGVLWGLEYVRSRLHRLGEEVGEIVSRAHEGGKGTSPRSRTSLHHRESEVTGMHPGSQEHRRGRDMDIAPTDGMNVLSGVCEAAIYT